MLEMHSGKSAPPISNRKPPLPLPTSTTLANTPTTWPINYSMPSLLLRRTAPLAGASMLKTSLLINELTCILGNAM